VITPVRHSGMARVLEGSDSFTCIPRVHPLTEWTIPAFAYVNTCVQCDFHCHCCWDD